MTAFPTMPAWYAQNDVFEYYALIPKNNAAWENGSLNAERLIADAAFQFGWVTFLMSLQRTRMINGATPTQATLRMNDWQNRIIQFHEILIMSCPQSHPYSRHEGSQCTKFTNVPKNVYCSGRPFRQLDWLLKEVKPGTDNLQTVPISKCTRNRFWNSPEGVHKRPFRVPVRTNKPIKDATRELAKILP